MTGRETRTVRDKTPGSPADLDGRPWVFDHDFFMLVNVAVGGTASRPPDHSVSFPHVMLVDYVRLYAAA